MTIGSCCEKSDDSFLLSLNIFVTAHASYALNSCVCLREKTCERYIFMHNKERKLRSLFLIKNHYLFLQISNKQISLNKQILLNKQMFLNKQILLNKQISFNKTRI